MPLTRSRFIRLLRIGALILAASLIAGYGLWRSFAYAQGPRIEVFTPTSGIAVASSTVDIIGKASRINSLALNGSPLSMDESGNFKDTRAIFPGINIFKLYATDQFGRSTEMQIEIAGQPPAKR